MEFVLARLQLKNNPDLHVVSFYQHTNSNPESLKVVSENMAKITNGKRFPNIIIAGDFNLPDINWAKHTVESSQYSSELNQTALDAMDGMFLTQMVSEPTRGANILALLLASSPDLIRNICIKPDIGDHDSVTAEVQLKAKVSKKTTRTIFMYDKADTDMLKHEISSLSSEFISTSSGWTVSENWKYFTTEIFNIVNKCVPKKIVQGTRSSLARPPIEEENK